MICCIRDCSYFLTIGTKKEKSFRWSKGLFGKLFLSANCLPNICIKCGFLSEKIIGPFLFCDCDLSIIPFLWRCNNTHTYSPYSYLISRNSSRRFQMFGIFFVNFDYLFFFFVVWFDQTFITSFGLLMIKSHGAIWLLPLIARHFH